MNRFENKTALITGGCSGIGKATAIRLAKEGCKIVVVDRDGSRGSATVQELQQFGGEALFMQTDLADQKAIERMASQVARQVDAVHVLVNNAGILGTTKPIEELTIQDWEPITAINLRAPLMVSLALLPLLQKQKGVIVNISSDGGLKGRAFPAIYDATKAGVISLTKSCAAGFAKYGIRVNVVAPGGTVTEMHYGAADNPALKRKEMEEFVAKNLRQRLARPEEIAAAIAFLASDEASHITGATLSVDGGWVGFYRAAIPSNFVRTDHARHLNVRKMRLCNQPSEVVRDRLLPSHDGIRHLQ
jgi:NAD(P)-dependent dehydrogenase (short-subunit alcohol dehydrogenase family)